MAETPKTTADTEVEPQPEDVRERFKAALARKNARATEGEKHLNSGSKVHDAHSRVGGKRQFRRKSG
ncbi:DUF5302 domain-containing protein [Actinokineospora sp. NPDC004072]